MYYSEKNRTGHSPESPESPEAGDASATLTKTLEALADLEKKLKGLPPTIDVAQVDLLKMFNPTPLLIRRFELGLTTRQLGELAGCSPHAISRTERGIPLSPIQAKRIARVTGLDERCLLYPADYGWNPQGTRCSVAPFRERPYARGKRRKKTNGTNGANSTEAQ